jgi:hypothetical protein
MEDFVFPLHPEIHNVIFGKIAEFAQDRGMIAPELISNGPGVKILLDEKCNNFID